jgi:hypothetical protein
MRPICLLLSLLASAFSLGLLPSYQETVHLAEVEFHGALFSS